MDVRAHPSARIMRPDLSGDWILDRGASRLGPGAEGMVTAGLHIEHDDPRFRCTGRFSSSDDTMEFTFELLAREREEASRAGETSSCFWERDALVTEFRPGTPDAPVVMTWHYELARDAGRLRATERIRGGGRDQDNVWEFARD